MLADGKYALTIFIFTLFSSLDTLEVEIFILFIENIKSFVNIIRKMLLHFSFFIKFELSTYDFFLFLFLVSLYFAG